METFVYLILLAAGIIIAFITWRISDFFLSRRDYYVNSPYELLKMKLKMALTAGALPLVFAFFAFQGKNKKTKETELDVIMIYDRPDNKSQVIYRDSINQKILIIDSTKYFYKVHFSDNSNVREGYIEKQKWMVEKKN